MARKRLTIVFRADASVHIGTGHVMRCLTLADVLRERGAECLFICRPHAGHLLGMIAKRGHSTVELSAPTTAVSPAVDEPRHAQWLGADWASDAQETRKALGADPVDWLVVDHYALDRRWEQVLRSSCQRLMVIDDLADRAHDCDVLLDQNLGRAEADYRGLVGPHTIAFIGPRYALLRPEFSKLRAASLARREQPQLKRLLITMGGVDKDNATGRVLDALNTCSLPEEFEITVVMGPHAPWLQQVQVQAAQMSRPTRVLLGVSDMAGLMADSDLAIGAAGSTSWERCCLGVPSIQLTLAMNQTEIANALTGAGAALSASVETLNCVLNAIFSDSNALSKFRSLGFSARSIADGRGAERIADALMGEIK